MRNVLTNHRIDAEKVIDLAIQACANDSKACMSSIANKGYGGLSNVKLPADTSYFGYIPNIKAIGYNWQTNAHNESTTYDDQYWQWALYNDDGTVNKTYRQNSSFPRGRGHVGYGVHNWNQSGFTKTFTFPWVDGDNTSHGLSELGLAIDSNRDASMMVLGVGGKGKYIYVLGWGYTNDNSIPSHSLGVFDTETKNGTLLLGWGLGNSRGECFVENKNTIRAYMTTYFDDWRSYGGYIDINKDSGTVGSFVDLGYQNALDFVSAHPNGEYEDLEGTTPYINLGAHSQGAFFNGQKVGTGGYFQRGRDNKAQAYIYRPVNLTTGNATQGAAIQ